MVGRTEGPCCSLGKCFLSMRKSQQPGQSREPPGCLPRVPAPCPCECSGAAGQAWPAHSQGGAARNGAHPPGAPGLEPHLLVNRPRKTPGGAQGADSQVPLSVSTCLQGEVGPGPSLGREGVGPAGCPGSPDRRRQLQGGRTAGRFLQKKGEGDGPDVWAGAGAQSCVRSPLREWALGFGDHRYFLTVLKSFKRKCLIGQDYKLPTFAPRAKP